MLSLIQRAEDLGVTQLETLVGYVKPEGGGAEFGSTSSDRRIIGQFEVTSMALSVTVDSRENGNSYVMIHAIFPTEINAFGTRGLNFNATLINWVDTGRARLTVSVPGLGIREKEWFHELQQVYEFTSEKPYEETAWVDIPFKLERKGCIILLTQINKPVFFK